MASNSTENSGVPTLHHLGDSQSQRILWLLEELEIEYNLKNYTRDKNQRAPPELAQIHPLGRSPTLVTTDGRVLIESITIATYLLKTYDTAGRFSTEDWIRDETLCSFAGASLSPIMSIELLFDLAAKHTPWPFKFIMNKIKSSYDKFFSNAEFKKNMTYLEGELSDSEWFNGKQLGRCDVMLSWPLDMMTGRGYINVEKDYPKIHAWRQRIQERPAWKRGLEKGTTYNLASW